MLIRLIIATRNFNSKERKRSCKYGKIVNKEENTRAELNFHSKEKDHVNGGKIVSKEGKTRAELKFFEFNQRQL